ncbi:MAG: NlpC/P60 family protein [Bacteroidota bacterium]
MVKQIVPAIAFIFLLSSCSSFKSLNFTSNRQVSSENAPSSHSKNVRFIDDISITPQIITDKTEVKPESRNARASSTRSVQVETPAQKHDADEISQILASRTAEVEAVSSVQLKYAVLMNTEVESLPAKELLDNVDEWYGVRYRTGGNTKSGVDCSGFTFAVYMAVYGIALPRVSREQYRISRKISTTELQSGDLVFFNTKGNGVSHVGVYLGNNRFIHASVSRGVMVSDLSESYYVQRYYGAGRIDAKQMVKN